MKIIHDEHITIFELLKLYLSYLKMNLYDDLMMLNKFESELLAQVTVVLLFIDPHDLQNIWCNFLLQVSRVYW